MAQLHTYYITNSRKEINYPGDFTDDEIQDAIEATYASFNDNDEIDNEINEEYDQLQKDDAAFSEINRVNSDRARFEGSSTVVKNLQALNSSLKGRIQSCQENGTAGTVEHKRKAASSGRGFSSNFFKYFSRDYWFCDARYEKFYNFCRVNVEFDEGNSGIKKPFKLSFYAKKITLQTGQLYHTDFGFF